MTLMSVEPMFSDGEDDQNAWGNLGGRFAQDRPPCSLAGHRKDLAFSKTMGRLCSV